MRAGDRLSRKAHPKRLGPGETRRWWGGKGIMTDVTILATGLGFPEGPVVCTDGSVVLTEIRNRRCSRVAADGRVSLFSDCGGGCHGVRAGPPGCRLCW